MRFVVRGESGVAGEGRVVGIPKFHSWGKYTTPLTIINSDWISIASSGLCINLYCITWVLYFASSGVMVMYVFLGPHPCVMMFLRP